MALGATSRADQRPSRRVTDLLSSTAVNTLIGMVGLIAPAIAYALKRDIIKDLALASATIIILGLVARAQYLRSAEVRLRKAKAEEMSDPRMFSEIEAAILQRSIDHVEELADGYITIFSSEVPPMSMLLYRVLASSTTANRRVRAMDLTTDPKILLSRHDYLTANRHLISSGGTIERVFICRRQDLHDKEFARALLTLIAKHQGIGVQCGIAVRDVVATSDALDAVIFDRAAVLVESEQANVEYTSGWSTIHFKRVENWIKRFQRVWEQNETPAATDLFAAYSNISRLMLESDRWDSKRIEAVLPQLT